MTGLTLLIPLAIGVGLVGVGAFLWAVQNGQYEDLDGAAMRILIDEDAPGPDDI